MVPCHPFVSRPVALCLAILASGALAEALPQKPTAALFLDDLPHFNHALARHIGSQVATSGYDVQPIGCRVLTNESLLDASRFDLLVLVGARSLPASSIGPVERYLNAGGDLLALGLPGWDSPLHQAGGRWITAAEYDRVTRAQPATHLIPQFTNTPISRWTRSAGDVSGKAQYSFGAVDGRFCLHAAVERLSGWDTLATPPLASPFPPGQTLTCFRARGGPATRQIALEWRQDDSSRWIAVVNLTTNWTSCSLAPEAFKPWPVPTSTTNRFDPRRASVFVVGLALSHNALEGARHDFWFADFGTAAHPLGDLLPPAAPHVPRLESLAPSHQCFSVTTPVVVRPDHQQTDFAPPARPPEALVIHDPADLRAFHPRPRGIGFNQDRPFRWEPLLGAYDAKTGDYRGAVSVLIAHFDGPCRGGVWNLYTPDDDAFYRSPATSNCLARALTRMKQGVFLREAGAEHFTLFPDQLFRVGARVVNLDREAISNLNVEIQFLDPESRGQRTVLEGKVSLRPGESKALEQDGLALSHDEETVATSLTLRGQILDRLRHDIATWRPKAQPRFIEATNGGFRLAGKPWKAHGVNYMPSTGIGVSSARFFEHWLAPGSYDPVVIERDLRRIKGLGLNAVSVFIYHESIRAQNLLDFLRRCDRLGLRVNQSLRPGTPMNFRWNEMKELIERYRLAEQDVIFAYDLAWEPSHNDQAHQERAYTALWNEWVLKKHGTISSAEKRWNCGVPRTAPGEPQIRVPTMAQLTSQGDWTPFAADYRLFLDDLLRERYDAARQLVRSTDPHHPVSFRMTCAGDPTYNWEGALQYDFHGLAGGVDIWEPEAYGRIGDWQRVKPGQFTAAYARLCDPSKPLLWAEMGYSVWDNTRMAPDPEKLAFEARYYSDFYRMMKESGADGVFFWWYPGGFRMGENSDFGIINPDGTDRPVTIIIRREGHRFLAAPKPPPPNYWIAIDRDRDPRGLYGIYEAVKDEFWQAIERGNRPGLKWAKTPGP
jgi:hypothetical protein